MADLRCERLSRANWEKYVDQVMEVEAVSYEPSRRESREFLENILDNPRGLAIVCFQGKSVLGFCFGAPLECFPDVGGTKTDPEWNKGTTLYSADVTVAPKYRNQGLGYLIKREQMNAARSLGYKFIAGRNRVGLADSMMAINRKLGAYGVQYIKDGYPDDLPQTDCVYYHIDLTTPAGTCTNR